MILNKRMKTRMKRERKESRVLGSEASNKQIARATSFLFQREKRVKMERTQMASLKPKAKVTTRREVTVI